MHYDPQSFNEAKDDPGRISETGNPECVAGCYRCVLSYFNQPDHELIDRRDASALSFLLRLVHSFPRDASQTHTSDEAKETPPPDEEPLLIDGMTFANVWRKARLVVIEEGEARDDVLEKLASKGVRIMERPADPRRHAAFEEELFEALKG